MCVYDYSYLGFRLIYKLRSVHGSKAKSALSGTLDIFYA